MPKDENTVVGEIMSIQLQKTFYGKVSEIINTKGLGDALKISLINDAIEQESQRLTRHALSGKDTDNVTESDLYFIEYIDVNMVRLTPVTSQ